MSKNHDNILMWSHYAEKHTGVVLGFRPCVEMDSVLRSTEPVIYTATKPMLNYNSVPRDFVYSAIYHKAIQWNYEQEYRIHVLDKLVGSNDKKYANISFYPQELIIIYFGCKVKKEDQEEIIKGYAGKSRDSESILYLTTSGLATCVGVLIWRGDQTGLVAHLDSDSDNETYLRNYFEKFLDFFNVSGTSESSHGLRVTIISNKGSRESTELGEKTAGIAVGLLGCSVETKEYEGDVDIGLKLRTGEIMPYRERNIDVINPDNPLTKNLLNHKRDLSFYALRSGEVCPLNLPSNNSEFAEQLHESGRDTLLAVIDSRRAEFPLESKEYYYLSDLYRSIHRVILPSIELHFSQVRIDAEVFFRSPGGKEFDFPRFRAILEKLERPFLERETAMSKENSAVEDKGAHMDGGAPAE